MGVSGLGSFGVLSLEVLGTRVVGFGMAHNCATSISGRTADGSTGFRA